MIVLSNRFASQVTEIDADNREPITASEGLVTTTTRPVPSTTHTFTSDPENNVGVNFIYVLLASNCQMEPTG